MLTRLLLADRPCPSLLRPPGPTPPHARHSVGTEHFRGREENGQEGKPSQRGGGVGDGRARGRRKALGKQGKRSAAEFHVLLVYADVQNGWFFFCNIFLGMVVVVQDLTTVVRLSCTASWPFV